VTIQSSVPEAATIIKGVHWSESPSIALPGSNGEGNWNLCAAKGLPNGARAVVFGQVPEHQRTAVDQIINCLQNDLKDHCPENVLKHLGGLNGLKTKLKIDQINQLYQGYKQNFTEDFKDVDVREEVPKELLEYISKWVETIGNLKKDLNGNPENVVKHLDVLKHLGGFNALKTKVEKDPPDSADNSTLYTCYKQHFKKDFTGEVLENNTGELKDYVSTWAKDLGIAENTLGPWPLAAALNSLAGEVPGVPDNK